MIDRRTLLLSAASLGITAGGAWAQGHSTSTTTAASGTKTTTTTTTVTTTTTTVGRPIPLAPPPPIHIDTEDVLLWPSLPPGGGGPAGPPVIDAHGAVGGISQPMMTVYKPPVPNGTVVIIAAGGGYKMIEIGPEARPVALWLAAQGITACVLNYRLPGDGWGNGIFVPFQDAQRAVRLVRATSIGDWQAPPPVMAAPGAPPAPPAPLPLPRPKRVGVMGFSAGGHLMGMASAQWATEFYPPQDGFDTIVARPDFAALIYPVITLRPPFDDTQTRRALLGDHPTLDESTGWSVESHVKDDCPPVFLVHAADDRVASPENSAIMAAACQRVAVPVERMILPSGGHAFGLGQPNTPPAAWPAQFLAWQARA